MAVKIDYRSGILKEIFLKNLYKILTIDRKMTSFKKNTGKSIMKGYIQKLRSKIGHDIFIHPAARIIIENEQGLFLFLKRADNGQLGIPAGALEEGETIADCIKREVREETGLRLTALEVIGISSNPKLEQVTYPNSDQIQYFTIEFYSNKWEGELEILDTKEITSVVFMAANSINKLPKNEQSAFESLAYYRKHNSVMLK